MVKEHDWGTNAPGPILRTTAWTYLSDPAYTAKAMNGLIHDVRQGRLKKDETAVFIHTEVGWAEVQEVRFRDQAHAFRVSSASHPTGLALRVEGATIIIADIYDRPLHVIHERITALRGRA